MPKYCPECGISLEKDYKFCPSCGISLSNLKKEDIAEKSSGLTSENIRMIVCENCGEENVESNSVCEGCGVKLSGNVVLRTTKMNKKNIITEPLKPISSEKKKKQNTATPDSKDVEKVLDSKKLLVYVSILIGGIIIILATSGVFSSTPVNTTLPTNTNNQSSGVDLTNLNEINRLQAIVDSIPDDDVTLLELAHLLNDSGLYPKAIESYKRYLEKNEKDADARIDMGVCYYNLKDYDNAIKEMTTALKYKPDHQIGHLNLGIVNLSMGNLEKSKEWLQKAIDLNSNNEVGKRAQELLHSH